MPSLYYIPHSILQCLAVVSFHDLIAIPIALYNLLTILVQVYSTATSSKKDCVYFIIVRTLARIDLCLS